MEEVCGRPMLHTEYEGISKNRCCEKTIKFNTLLLCTNNKKLFYLDLTLICC